MSTAKEILTSDDLEAQAALLLSLLSDAASGRDLTGVVGEIIQVALAATSGHAQVKRLTYDLCRLVTLSDLDCAGLISALKRDVISGQADVQAAALQYIPSLPPHHLRTMLEQGDVGFAIHDATSSGSAVVRAAGVSCLGAVLLVPEVLACIGASPGLMSSMQLWWGSVLDGLLDSAGTVAAAATAAVARLLQAAEAGSSSPEARLIRQMAGTAVQSIAAAIGPVVKRLQSVPPQDQVDAVQLQGLLAKHLCQAGATAETEISLEGSTVSAAAARAAHVALLASAIIRQAGSANSAVRMEAGKQLLAVVHTISTLPRGANQAELAGIMQPSWASTGVAALMSLKERQLVEAALDDIAMTIIRHLPDVPIGQRLGVARQVMPLVASLPDMAARMRALVSLWSVLVELHLHTQRARTRGEETSWGSSLTSVLGESFMKVFLSDPGASQPAGDSAGQGSTQPPAAAAPTAKDDKGRRKPPAPPTALGSMANIVVPPSMKQELVSALLGVLAQHPLAVAATSQGEPTALVMDGQDPTQEAAAAECQADIVHWIGASAAVLQATQVCIMWEPHVPTSGASAAPFAPAHDSSFTTVPADAWLQLLQRCHAGVRVVLSRLGFGTFSALLASNKGRMLESLGPADNGVLAKTVGGAASLTQQMAKKLMSDWPALSHAVRPRALWVSAHLTELTPILDDVWARLLAGLEDVLVRLPQEPAERHSRQLAASAVAGCLQRPPPAIPQGAGADKALVLTALTELPEYMTDGLQVGMLLLQHLTWLLDDSLHDPGVRAGRLRAPAPLLGLKLRQITRHVLRLEDLGADIRAWCRRLLKTLTSVETLAENLTAVGEQTNGQMASAASVDSELDDSDVGHADGPKAPPPPLAVVALASTSTSMGAPRGYPFGKLRSMTLAASKRGKQHQVMQGGLDEALHALAPGAGEDSSAADFLTDSSVRLDSRKLWAGATASGSWCQVSGASDPLIISVCCAPSDIDPQTLMIHIKAQNRLDSELALVEVHARLVGPAVAERRMANWQMPRLKPQEAAKHQLPVRITGFGRVEVHLSAVLPVSMPVGVAAVPQLSCSPLPVPLTALLQAPHSSTHSTHFFSLWPSLPCRVELSGVCVWPGMRGAAALVSSLEGRPFLQQAWLHQQPALCAVQAAYISSTAREEVVAVLVMAQLMPPTPGSPFVGPLGNAVVQILVRSTSQEVVSTILEHAGQWVEDLSLGSVALGLSPPPSIPLTLRPPDLRPAGRQMMAAYLPRREPEPPAEEQATAAVDDDDSDIDVGVGPATAKDSWLKEVAVAEWARMHAAA